MSLSWSLLLAARHTSEAVFSQLHGGHPREASRRTAALSPARVAITRNHELNDYCFKPLIWGVLCCATNLVNNKTSSCTYLAHVLEEVSNLSSVSVSACHASAPEGTPPPHS